MPNKILIHHHLGLGDHIVCNAIVRKIYSKNENITLAVKPHNLISIQSLYKDIPLDFLVGEDYEIESLYEKYDVLRIGFENCNVLKWEQSFYKQMNIDYAERYTNFYIQRDFQAEKQLEERLNLPNEFAFCNTSYSGGEISIDIQSFLPKIHLSKITDNIFDWIGVLEKATEIHIIDSSIFHLIKQLGLRCHKYFYDIRNLGICRTNFNLDLSFSLEENQSWKVIDA